VEICPEHEKLGEQICDLKDLTIKVTGNENAKKIAFTHILMTVGQIG